jgi:hypothetical protein
MQAWFAMPNRNMLNDNQYLSEQTMEAYESLLVYMPKEKQDFILNPPIPTYDETELVASRSEQNNQYNNNVEQFEPWPQTFNSNKEWEKYNRRLFNFGKF